MSILQEILARKKEELQKTKSDIPLSDLKAEIRDMAAVKPFGAAIKRDEKGPVRLIAELKKASPSKGLIRENFNLSQIVSIYDRKDVAALSVLTEKHFFSGDLSYLKKARERTGKPLLRKDFIFNEYQVYESRANCADAILLIAATLERSQMSDLFELAKELSLDCLMEVHNWKELDRVLYCNAPVIGINNRDLNTLNISLDISLNLLKDIPDDRITVSESGIYTRSDVEAIEAGRADAVLVGTTIMQADDIGAKIDELTGKRDTGTVLNYDQ